MTISCTKNSSHAVLQYFPQTRTFLTRVTDFTNDTAGTMFPESGNVVEEITAQNNSISRPEI
jgi:hypothetical protein